MSKTVGFSFASWVLLFPCAVSAATDRALILGVLHGKNVDRRLTQDLNTHVLQSGHVELATYEPSTKERLCVDQECLAQIASRAETQYLLRASITASRGNNYFLSVNLFDASSQSPTQTTDVCEQCSSEQVQSKLFGAADNLLLGVLTDRNQAASRPFEPPQETTSLPSTETEVEPPPAEITPKPSSENPGVPEIRRSPMVTKPTPTTPFLPPMQTGMSPGRKALIGVFSTVTGLALGTGITLTLFDRELRDSGCSDSRGCALDTRLESYVAYAVAGASLVGLLISLPYPQKAGSAPQSRPKDTVVRLPFFQPITPIEVR